MLTNAWHVKNNDMKIGWKLCHALSQYLNQIPDARVCIDCYHYILANRSYQQFTACGGFYPPKFNKVFTSGT